MIRCTATRVISALTVVTLGPGLASCATAVPGSNDQEAIVQIPFDYAPDQKAMRQWRALLDALDECHRRGYRDANLVAPPQAICTQQEAGGCSHFRATSSYSCIGMGYQPE